MVTASPRSSAPKMTNSKEQQKPRPSGVKVTPQKKSGFSTPPHHQAKGPKNNSEAKVRAKTTGKKNSVSSSNWHQNPHQFKKSLQFQTPTPTKRPSPPPMAHSQSTPAMMSSRSSTTPSPRNFAGSKCYEPPTPDSLPRPPKSWTASSTSAPLTSLCSFQDLVTQMQRAEEEKAQMNLESRDDVAEVSQHLKYLLKVQA